MNDPRYQERNPIDLRSKLRVFIIPASGIKIFIRWTYGFQPEFLILPESKSSSGRSLMNIETEWTVENWSAVCFNCASTLGKSHSPPSISVPLRWIVAVPELMVISPR